MEKSLARSYATIFQLQFSERFEPAAKNTLIYN